MSQQKPIVNIDILVIQDNQILLGLLADTWTGGEALYGVPGRDVLLNETIGEAVARNIQMEFDCEVDEHEVICVNANYENGNHYIGVGVIASIEGEVKLLQKEDWKEWQWFDIDNLPQNLFAPARNVIECYLSGKVCVSE